MFKFKPLGWPPPPRDPRRHRGVGALSGWGWLLLLVVALGLLVGFILLAVWG